MSTFHIYVSAQTDTPLTRPVNLARVMQAIPDIPGYHRVNLTEARTGTGVWRDSREPIVILTFSGDAMSWDAVSIARYLADSLAQESVLVVAKVTDADSGMTYQNGWQIARRSERDLGEAYTVLDGMGQRPYAYVPNNRGDYSMNLVSDY